MNKEIIFSSGLAATLTFEGFLNIMLKHQSDYFSQDVIRDAFRVFDPKATGIISKTKLEDVMKKRCETVDTEELKDMLKDAPADGEGNVRYEGKMIRTSLVTRTSRLLVNNLEYPLVLSRFCC